MDACAPLGFVLGILLDLQTVANEGAPPGFAPAARSRQATLEERYLELPRADSMRRYLNILTQEPRRAGTPGAESSARFVAEQLKGMGFEVETPVFYGYPVRAQDRRAARARAVRGAAADAGTWRWAVDKDLFRRDVVVAHKRLRAQRRGHRCARLRQLRLAGRLRRARGARHRRARQGRDRALRATATAASRRSRRSCAAPPGSSSTRTRRTTAT
ncbi:MAG: hypothetical protein U1E76_20120 [Planctomycetota bacterium]